MRIFQCFASGPPCLLPHPLPEPRNPSRCALRPTPPPIPLRRTDPLRARLPGRLGKARFETIPASNEPSFCLCPLKCLMNVFRARAKQGVSPCGCLPVRAIRRLRPAPWAEAAEGSFLALQQRPWAGAPDWLQSGGRLGSGRSWALAQSWWGVPQPLSQWGRPLLPCLPRCHCHPFFHGGTRDRWL